MTDLRPAQDVAAEITRCEEGRTEDYDDHGRVIARDLPYCIEHGEEGWPCPELIRVTALIKADRKAAMAKAWDEGHLDGWADAESTNSIYGINPYEQEGQ